MKKGVNLFAVVALGLGTAVGVSIFSALAPATAVAGPGMLLAVVIAALPIFVVALTYAFMGSALPVTGASYEWPRRFLHPFAGFLVAWLRIAASTGAMLLLALVLVRYAAMLVPLPVKPAMFGCFVGVFLLNLFGVAIAARAQTILTTIMVVLLLLFAAAGLPHVEPARFSPVLPHGWFGVAAAIPLLVSLFFGLEAATEVGEEVRDSRSAIPRGIALSIAAALLLYLIVGTVALGMLGAPTLGSSSAPLLEAAAVPFGEHAKPVVVALAVVAIGKSLNAIFLLLSRNLFALGRSGVLPPVLARIHPRWGTPHVAVGAAFAVCALGLLLPLELAALFLAVSIPTLLKYASSCLSAVRMIEREPALYQQAAFKFSPTRTRRIAWLGAASSVLVMLLGITSDWRPYALLAGWAALGAIVYAVRPG
jgi:basic amino acid/polyamine antiporter, APA family